MKLGEFIENFSHNNLIRLLYKFKGGHISVLENFDEVSMDHEVNDYKGPYARYKDHKVLGLASILCDGRYPEAINIVIEEIPLDEMRNNQLTKLIGED
jgi:hypothetical protein